jgi:hypothetical protein
MGSPPQSSDPDCQYSGPAGISPGAHGSLRHQLPPGIYPGLAVAGLHEQPGKENERKPRGEVAQTMYTHVRKCKNNQIKI